MNALLEILSLLACNSANQGFPLWFTSGESEWPASPRVHCYSRSGRTVQRSCCPTTEASLWCEINYTQTQKVHSNSTFLRLKSLLSYTHPMVLRLSHGSRFLTIWQITINRMQYFWNPICLFSLREVCGAVFLPAGLHLCLPHWDCGLQWTCWGVQEEWLRS